MPSWVQWINSRIEKFYMLRSIWFANMDVMVDNIRYLHDDGDEHKQSDFSDFAHKPNESQFGDKSIHKCTKHDNRYCNCTDTCSDGYDDNDSDDPIVNIDHIYDVKRFFNEHIYEFDELHNKLIRQEGCSEGYTEGKRDCSWVRNSYEYGAIESRLQHATTTNARIH
jgi:hypothetical protein